MMSWATILLYLCSINSVIIWAQNPIGLKASASLRGLLIGTAVRVLNLQQDVDGGQYATNLKKNYQLVVPEGELKPRSIWFGENIYNWTNPDWLLGATSNSTGWVQQNGLQIRGHNLVWAPDKWTPDWLVKQESSISPDKAKSLLSDYIHAVVDRYRGKIPWWDVVNEAIDDSNNTHALNLRDCFWFRKLGPDFIKYAFMFAHEADPNVQLHYNEYGIESVGLKANRTIDLANWLRMQGATIHGIGLQWHIGVSTTVTPGDVYYQSAQHFIDQRLDFMVTELDVSVPTSGGYPIDSKDLEKQGLVYRVLLQYVLHFSPNCRAMLTWGYTDRYSWIPSYHNDTVGGALPLDWLYLPKSAYWQMQEELARVLVDGIYRLSPQSQPEKCLGIANNGTSTAVQLYSGACDSGYQTWHITWLGDGTYVFSTEIHNNGVLGAYNATATIGGVQMFNWTSDVNQKWAFSPQGNNKFRIVPRTAW
jgi:endo-1,4-beta-xylanase